MDFMIIWSKCVLVFFMTLAFLTPIVYLIGKNYSESERMKNPGGKKYYWYDFWWRLWLWNCSILVVLLIVILFVMFYPIL